MNEFQERHIEKTIKHNKRVASIRDTRLPKSCVEAIDGAIDAMDQLHEAVIDGVTYGHHPLSMSDIVTFVEAANKLRSEFTARQVPKYD